MAGTSGTLEPQLLEPRLLDLSGVPLGELGAVRGLPAALASLRRELAHTAAPLCSTDSDPRHCPSSLVEQAGSGHES